MHLHHDSLSFLPLASRFATFCDILTRACAEIKILNIGLSDFEINYKANVLGGRTQRFGVQIFKLFVMIKIGSYA